ncbi:mechanosensitive ion channel family protein [Polaribacter sp. IC073]|uniref:mechanosensitive ion channel family protein n=1 Tax=Polaribacter sp. IC073 TaxID=2508540 RepID=UPI0011BFCC5C|nr:mechanosensitive ion channel family protein [Polaribacter sp. IC073]TXD46752.1 mechanosensitive ion channel family protein [Polaribacter sp. IC073]
MKDFLITYKGYMYWVVGVLIAVIILRFLTNLLHNWLLKKELEKFPEEQPKTVNLVKRILNALWVVLGLIGMSFIFVGENKYAIILKNIELVLYLGLMAVFTIVAAATTNMWFKTSIERKVKHNDDPTSLQFLRNVIVVVIYFLGIVLCLLAFPSMRGLAHTALGGAGVIALIAGVASQEALSNVIGGIFIISFKPFKIGDLIKVTDDMVGTVTDITLRHTIIRNFENKMIVIPNAIINKEKLINYDLGELKCCERIEIKIGFDSDVDVAKRIMQEECEAHPLLMDNRSFQEKKEGKPIAKTALIEMSEYCVTLRVWAWAHNFSDCFQLKIDVLETIKKRFKENNIERPSPNRTIIFQDKKTDLETT